MTDKPASESRMSYPIGGDFSEKIAYQHKLEAHLRATTAALFQTMLNQHSNLQEGASMPLFLLVYEPCRGDWNDVRTGINPALKTILMRRGTYWSYLDRVWITTAESADALWKDVKSCFGDPDRALVIEIQAGSTRQGLLDKKAWEWFNSAVGSRKEATRTSTGEHNDAPSAVPDSGALFQSTGVTLTPIQPPQADDPKPESPQHAAIVPTWTCGFCGVEAPKTEWVKSACPRCGITRTA